MSEDPITGIAVIENPLDVPEGYQVIAATEDGKDADIWKDGFFGRAVRRYICFTKVFPLDNGRWRNVVKDIKIVKDTAGAAQPGYVVISHTMAIGRAQQPQPALQGVRLLIKNELRDNCEGAFTNLILVSKGLRNEKTIYIPTDYIKVGELNGMFLYGKWRNLPPLTAPAAPLTNGSARVANQSNNNPDNATRGGGDDFEVVERRETGVFRPDNQWSAMTLERQKTEVLTTGIDGIQFVINPKYCNSNQSSSQFVLPLFDTMSMQQINNKYNYSIQTERSLVNG